MQKLQFIVTSNSKLKFLKIYCNICNNKQPSVCLCNVSPLKPDQHSHRFMHVLFDTECTHDLEQRDGYFVNYTFVHVLRLCTGRMAHTRVEE